MTVIEPLSLFLPDETATDALGVALSRLLLRGDCLLLRGPIGAGKSHLARALIRSFLGRMEEIPSPTFTLVQVYDAGETEIWHADLYRLSHTSEIEELGLEAAFAEAICIVEWPDRLGALAPAEALNITLSVEGEGRRATLEGAGRAGELIAALGQAAV
jgi:tRNA threonylcarbamoyladenosine biosynthesis protein TsaE